MDANGYFYKPEFGHASDSLTTGKDPDNPAFHRQQYERYVNALSNITGSVTGSTANTASIRWIEANVPNTSSEDGQQRVLMNSVANLMDPMQRADFVHSPIGECGASSNCALRPKNSVAKPEIRKALGLSRYSPIRR